MRSRTMFATALVAGLMGTIVGVSVATASSAAAADCPNSMIFEVGGHLDPDAHIYNQSNAALPAGVAFTQIHYPASIAPYPGDTVSMDDSVAQGIATLDHAALAFHANCVGSHVTVSGYSEGAIVAGDELASLGNSKAIPSDVLNGVLYGDPRRVPVNGGPGGIETNIPTIIPGITMRGPRGFGALAVQEICNQNDGICNSENPLTNFLGFANGVDGYFSGAHGQYDFNPVAHSGVGNSVTPQTPLIPYGPDLPLPVPTLYQLFNGNMSAAQQNVRPVYNELANTLSPQLRQQLALFPWLPLSS